MKLCVRSESETVFSVPRHYEMLTIIHRSHNFSPDAIIGYLKEYKPEIDWPSHRDYHNFAFRLAGKDCRLPVKTRVAVLEYLIDADEYAIDVNSASFAGSPLVMYAIQGKNTEIVDLLVSKGARLTVGGRAITNIYNLISKYGGLHVNIPYCIGNDSNMRACVARHMFNEITLAQ